MLAWSQPSSFERTGSQVGNKPRAGVELSTESWEAAGPPVLYTLSHILALRVLGLDFPGLDSAPSLGAFSVFL